MRSRKGTLPPLEDRGPLRVMFLITSMPVGGAETLLINLIRRLDRQRFAPTLGCFKELGPLGDVLAGEIPTFHDLIKHRYDGAVVFRLARLLRRERIDAVVTVGAGDKMFWGRLAARVARVPVVLSAIHSTGWPDGIGRLNGSRLLTRWTDGFIAVAAAHGRHLVEQEGFPAEKVHVIPNGVDVDRFRPRSGSPLTRRELGIAPSAPLAGIVAALRPEKNHALFLRAAARVRDRISAAQFLIVGDGPERPALDRLVAELGLGKAVHFLGTRNDIPQLLAALDVFVLTSKIEANPVSILEAMAAGKPVVAPAVGSIGESVSDGRTGFLTLPNDESQVADRLVELLGNPDLARQQGQNGRREVIASWSLERMVEGYQDLIEQVYRRKSALSGRRVASALPPSGDSRPFVPIAP
jgi:glycosyltransferase involved in cell wall biosynthesis